MSTIELLRATIDSLLKDNHAYAIRIAELEWREEAEVKKIWEQLQRIEELRAALKWYADRANYAENPNADLRYIEGGPGTIVDADYGKRAREALKDDK
jgi:hypothetical protein